MDKTFFYVLLGFLAIVYFIVGYVVSKRVTTTQDYFLAGRSLGIFPLVVSLIATQLGGGFIIGTSKEAYTFGYYGLIYVAGICLGLLLLGSGIASRLRLFGVETTAQLFELRYNSIMLKKYASLCSIISLIGIFAAQVVASKVLMASLGTFDPLWFTVFWLFVIGYAMLGGLSAIVDNDIFQLSFIMVVFGILFIVDFFSVPAQSLSILWQSNSFFTSQAMGAFAVNLSILIIPACYALIEQDLAQIFFAARNARIAVIAALIAAFVLICFAFIPLFFGMKVKVLGLPLSNYGNPLMSYFDQYYPSAIAALVTYGILAAIISSANALLCAISSNIVQDFKLTEFQPRYALTISKAVMFSVGIVGLILSFYCNDIIGLLVDSYAIPVTSLFISLLVAYYSNGALSKTAAYTSVLVGLISFASLSLLKKSLLLSPALDALLLSAIGYLVGLMISSTKSRAKEPLSE